MHYTVVKHCEGGMEEVILCAGHVGQCHHIRREKGLITML